MPALKFHRVLVYFSAFKDHIGFFPTPGGITELKSVLTNYKTSKGTIRFSPDKDTPADLVYRITKFRLKEETERYNNKR